MAAQYQLFCSVRFRHAYFEGQDFTAISCTPDAATADFLQRLGLVFRTTPDGFSVLYDTQFAGSPRTREQVLQEKVTLCLVLSNNDPLLVGYTGGVAITDLSKTVFCFANTTAVGNNETRETLTAGETVGDTELLQVDEMPYPFFSKPFGLLLLTLHSGMPVQFEVRFQAKHTYWRYLLVSEHLRTLVNPAVVNRETREVFIGPEQMVLPDNREVLSFRSGSPVSLTAKPNKSFQLLENYEPMSGRGRVIIGILPNPVSGAITRLPATENAGLNFSEIFL
ncbi:MAG: hypothetical protein GXC72_10970 [Chitinophagaceae bacterium]|jgi:hypothetical protein|nr:hypothetical protein [Chitinophagaceae bacterium]